jgi:hypothetical protein
LKNQTLKDLAPGSRKVSFDSQDSSDLDLYLEESENTLKKNTPKSLADANLEKEEKDEKIEDDIDH